MFHVIFHLVSGRASLVAQMVKNLLTIQETEVRLLDWEDFLENSMDQGP